MSVTPIREFDTSGRFGERDAASRGRRNAPAILAGAVLGVGLGGSIDAVAFHQVLQWHHLLSGVVPPLGAARMKTLMQWDGLAALVLLGITVAGLATLWSALRRSGPFLSTTSFVASLGLGWGAFNVVEGVLIHHLLGLHHVRAGESTLAWDLAYLALSATLLTASALVLRREPTRAPRPIGTARPAAPIPTRPAGARTSPVLVTPPPRPVGVGRTMPRT